MPLERNDVEKALETKLGFQRLQRDHRVFVLNVSGRALETKTSHGTGYRTIGEELTHQMAKQLFVPHKFLVELVRCNKTSSDYLQLLAKRGIIPVEPTTGDR